MNRDAKFWIFLAAFQVLFGLAVFAITRDYYLADAPDAPVVHDTPANIPITGQSAAEWPNGIPEADITRMMSSAFNESTAQDPAEISRQADEFFANRQYDRAAEMYERLLAFGPNDADIYNNLGLTLHYLGRSTDALRKLNEGIAADPSHQRIWLTLGYVNSQLGNIEDARSALTTATQVGSDESIRQSATKMLQGLPQS